MVDSEPFRRFQEATLAANPRLAVVLGSGLSPVARRLQRIYSVPFSQIPGLSHPSVDGHEGRLMLGNWVGKTILVLEGRLHFYEGHSWETVCQPMHVIHSLGAKLLLATNAAGGIHPCLGPGSLMVIRDHQDWTRPWCARPDFRSLEDFGNFSEIPACRPSPYSHRLRDLLQRAAANLGMTLFSGCYAAVIGPNYETKAEIQALAKCGADAVGMSTAREIQTACELGLECAAISCVTNRAAGLEEGAIITHREVLETAAATCENLAKLIEAFIEIAA
jgi:purine-nucleoside phosphorylase